MPCGNRSHQHAWPSSGPLQIERCEIYCAYCLPPKNKKSYSDSRSLRLHVKRHLQPGRLHENVTLTPGKAGRPRRSTSPPELRYRNGKSTSLRTQDFVNEDEEMGIGTSTSRYLAARSAGTNHSRGLDRGAKRKAQEQIKIDSTLPVAYEPNPSPSPPPMIQGEEDSIMFSDDDVDSPVPLAKSSFQPPTGTFRTQPHPMITSRSDRDRMIDAAIPASSSGRQLYTSSHSGLSRRHRPRQASRRRNLPPTAVARISSTESSSDDNEPSTPPPPPPEAAHRVRLHRERKELEIHAAPHPKAGKRPVALAKDYSQLWAKEFEIAG